MSNPLIDSKMAESANAAAVAEEAHLNAIEARMHDRIATTVQGAIEAAMSPEKGRYLDISRVPLICQSIVSLTQDMREMKDSVKDGMSKVVTQDQFWPIKTLVYGFVVIILVAVVSALVLSAVPHGVISVP